MLWIIGAARVSRSVRHHHACSPISSTWIWRFSQHRSSTHLSRRWVGECAFYILALARPDGICLHLKAHESTRARMRRSARSARLLRTCRQRPDASGAEIREFDVGYELRPSDPSSRFLLRPDTLQRVAALGASLAVTYYRRDINDA
jgi:hypothetical protein